MNLAPIQAAYRAKHDYAMFQRPKNKQIPDNNPGVLVNLLMAQEIQSTDTEGLVNITTHAANGVWYHVTALPASKISTFLNEGFYIKDKFDYYMGKALSKKPHSYAADDTFAFSFISIDIDAHDYADKYTVSQTEYICSLLADYLCQTVPDDETYPQPNAVIFSGRGIHIIWCIHQELACHRKKVLTTANHLADMVREALDHDSRFDEFEIDYSSLHNLSGLMRLPGTVNSKNGAKCDFYIFHLNRYYLNELSPFVAASCFCPAQNQKVADDTAQTVPTALSRIKSLEQLNKIRHGIQHGLRDKFLLIFYCACRMAALPDQEALRRTLSINKELSAPRKEHNVISSLSTARKKNYFFQDATIVAWLQITAEERSLIHWHAFHSSNAGKHYARDAKRAARRANRTISIINAYEACESIAESARRADVSYNTAKKYIEEYLNGSNEATAIEAAVDTSCPAENNCAYPDGRCEGEEMATPSSSLPSPDTSFFYDSSFKNGRNIFFAYKNPPVSMEEERVVGIRGIKNFLLEEEEKRSREEEERAWREYSSEFAFPQDLLDFSDEPASLETLNREQEETMEAILRSEAYQSPYPDPYAAYPNQPLYPCQPAYPYPCTYQSPYLPECAPQQPGQDMAWGSPNGYFV